MKAFCLWTLHVYEFPCHYNMNQKQDDKLENENIYTSIYIFELLKKHSSKIDF